MKWEQRWGFSSLRKWVWSPPYPPGYGRNCARCQLEITLGPLCLVRLVKKLAEQGTGLNPTVLTTVSQKRGTTQGSADSRARSLAGKGTEECQKGRSFFNSTDDTKNRGNTGKGLAFWMPDPDAWPGLPAPHSIGRGITSSSRRIENGPSGIHPSTCRSPLFFFWIK